MSQFIAESAVKELVASFERGASIRQIAAAMNLSPVTVQSYRKKWLESRDGVLPLCDCGKPMGHNGWCYVRFSNSSKRQAAMAELTTPKTIFGKKVGPCRACGAVLAPRVHVNDYDLCDTCWNALCSFAGATYDWGKSRWNGSKVTEDQFLGWLARKMMKDLQRFQRNGVVGRCEALTNQGDAADVQCGLMATQMKEGHKVCSRHQDATENIYVTDRQSDYYQIFQDQLTILANADPRFHQILIASVAATEGKRRT